MVIFLLALTLLATACNPPDYSGLESASGDSNAIRYVFGLRNGMEINATMFVATSDYQLDNVPNTAADTKIDVSNKPDSSTPNSNTNCYKQNKKGRWQQKTMSSTYCQVSNLLPTASQVQSFTGTTQAGVFKLASYYCRQLMANDEKGKSARLAKLPTSAEELNELDLRQRPVELGKDLKKQLAKDLGDLISPSSTAEQQILIELIDDLAQTKEENGQRATLEEVLIGVCTAALGSAQTVFY